MIPYNNSHIATEQATLVLISKNSHTRDANLICVFDSDGVLCPAEDKING